jgi:hypothetical protein
LVFADQPKTLNMKMLYTFLLVLFSSVTLYAQMSAVTQDGRRVLLYANGNWQYADNSGGMPTGSISTQFNEAYDYAYDIVYSDEFFSGDRKLKSTQWAVQYVKDNLYVPIGTKSLDNWFDELYNFAHDNIYRTEFFGNDRKTKSIEWASNIITTKAFFEDNRSTYIQRHRMAYNFALNRIYRNEFFAQDRKRKALEWANLFVKR